MSTPAHSRRGEGVVDHLLVLSLAFVAVLVAAWIYMPDVKRSFATSLSTLLQFLGVDGL